MLKPELPLGAAVPTVADSTEIESEDDTDCIHLQDWTTGSEEKVEQNELGDEVATSVKKVDQIFDQNLYWRSSPRLAGKVEFSAITDGSEQDVHF